MGLRSAPAPSPYPCQSLLRCIHARAGTAGHVEAERTDPDPWAHLVNVVHDFLHAFLHCAQVLVFPELQEGQREISRLASTSSLQWMTAKMQGPAHATPHLPPRCPQPGPAPRIGDLCVMELISGREEESEHKEGLSSAVSRALWLTLLCDVLDPGASSNLIQG